MDVELSLNWHCKNEEVAEIPPSLFQLLQAIVDTGTLRAAADECKLSYRHAWGLIQRWQDIFGCSLVELKRGRGQKALLSAFSEKLLWEYQRISARIEPELASLASELSASLASTIKQKKIPTLRIAASHGLVIAQLRDLAKEITGLNLDMQFQGSLDCLQQYKLGHYDIAGFHLPEGQLGRRLLARLKPFIHAGTDRLVYALRRQQGLMMATDNPKNIKDLSDLLNPQVKFINRQKNSGSRITLDAILLEKGIDSDLINGYANEEFTHSAVGALVASGVADCGFGLEAAAAQFNLAFMPINWESYWFVLPKAQLNSSPHKLLIQLLQSDLFQQRVKVLKGYDSSRAGQVITPDKALTVLI